MAASRPMTAFQAVFDFDPWVRGQREFGIQVAALSKEESNRRQQALQARALLKQARLTMLEVSARSRVRFGEDSPYFIPRTFLYKRKAGITPHICQLIALGEITAHGLDEWMRICGFDATLILQLQLRLANERTTMLVPGCSFAHAKQSINNRYCYAKIGSRDAVLYPAVRPGTIVRADRGYSGEVLKEDSSSKKMWLVEHPMGITCCRIKLVGSQEVVLLPHHPPLSHWPLRIPTQARILGLIDRQLHVSEEREFEPLARAPEANISMWQSVNAKLTFSRLLRTARCRTGLTFRGAHRLTLRIAEIMNDRNFAISVGLLSDYEAMNKLPRHIEKLFALCVIYGIDLCELLQAAGVSVPNSAMLRVFAPKTSGPKIACRAANSTHPLGSDWRATKQETWPTHNRIGA